MHGNAVHKLHLYDQLDVIGQSSDPCDIYLLISLHCSSFSYLNFFEVR